MRFILVIKLVWSLNVIKTLYFNFRVFPFRIAIKFPVYFFGPVKFASLNGSVRLLVETPKRGMIQFGCSEENIIATTEPTRLSIDGELVFKGRSRFAHAIQLLVWDSGRLTIGDNSWMGSFTKLVAFRSVAIGNNFLASWECQIFDTDFHLIENSTTGDIGDPNGSVHIGDFVWLGSRVSILKHTAIPDGCIIATGSVCNKDYTKSCPEGSVIGGIPAKYIKVGGKYINDKHLERRLFKHFQSPVNFSTRVQRSEFKQ